MRLVSCCAKPVRCYTKRTSRSAARALGRLHLWRNSNGLASHCSIPNGECPFLGRTSGHAAPLRNERLQWGRGVGRTHIPLPVVGIGAQVILAWNASSESCKLPRAPSGNWSKKGDSPSCRKPSRSVSKLTVASMFSSSLQASSARRRKKAIAAFRTLVAKGESSVLFAALKSVSKLSTPHLVFLTLARRRLSLRGGTGRHLSSLPCPWDRCPYDDYTPSPLVG